MTKDAIPRRIDVVAGIIWDPEQDRFLAVQRPEGKPQAGFWEFPGGKVEPGETTEQALERELGEELRIKPVEYAFWREKSHDYEHLQVRLYFFHVRGYTGTPTAVEGHGLAWLTPRQACDKPFLAADTDIVRLLCDNGDAPA